MNRALELEAQPLQETEHASVGGEHLGDKAGNSLSAGILGQSFKQGGADSAALFRVVHHNRHFGAGGVA